MQPTVSALSVHRTLAVAAISTVLAWAGGAAEAATTALVNAKSDIYLAGAASVPNSDLGFLPSSISVKSGSTLNFGVTGTAILNFGDGSNVNDADGFGAAVTQSSNTGLGSISGLTAPGAGYLVGLFVFGTPSGPAPTALDFTVNGIGTAFAVLAPKLNQVFFIGDGLTGRGTGFAQGFVVPQGATALYLGISDACGYNGSPSCYDDNRGQFSVNVNETPEPTSLALSFLALAGLGVSRLRARRPQLA